MTMTQRIARELGVISCVAAACWPLTLLTRGNADAVGIMIVASVVVLTGLAMRQVISRSGVILGAGFLALMVGTALVTLRSGFALTPSGLTTLWSQAASVINQSVTPLPDRPAVIVVVAAAAGVLTWVIDYVGGTSRMPVLAVLPLAAPFVVAASALGSTIEGKYFIAAALAWTLLALATFTNSTRERLRSRASASVIGAGAVFLASALAIAGALQVSKLVPHRQTPALAQQGQPVDTSVDFSQSLDLSKDLNSKNAAPVLRYQTDATVAAPLRVTTSSVYRDGIWQPQALQEAQTQVRKNTKLAYPGLSSDTPMTTRKISVTLNGLAKPFVAVPTPLVAANFGAGNDTFAITRSGLVPLVKQTPPAYSVLASELGANARPTSAQNASPTTATVTPSDLDISALPAPARRRVAELSDSVTQRVSTATPFDKAVAIQRHFRLDRSYTYSLTLAPTKEQNGAPLDPLSNFLDTKQEYCTQFATAMVMMARTQGIPARIAIGFLPGTMSSNGTYNVRASDAHAWPELYFPGLGWTRFDPTPGSRSGMAPPYAPDVSDGAASSASPSSSSSVQPSPSSRKTPASRSSTPSSSPTTPPSSKTSENILGATFKVLLIVALLAAVASLLPWAGRRERRRLFTGARSPELMAEAHWHELTWSLRDLGYTVTTGVSPRASATAFRRDNPGSPAVGDAFERACARFEQARYAPASSGRKGTSAKDAVIHIAREQSSWPRRIVAALLPLSGRSFLSRLMKRQ